MLGMQDMDELAALLRGDLAGIAPYQIIEGLIFDLTLNDDEALAAVAKKAVPALLRDRTLAPSAYRAYESWPGHDHCEFVEFVHCVHERGQAFAAEHGPWLPLLTDEDGRYFDPSAFAGVHGFVEAMQAHGVDAGITVGDGGFWLYVYPAPPPSVEPDPIKVDYSWVLCMQRDGFATPALVEALAACDYRQDIVGPVLRGIAAPLAEGAL